jgi:hypothetical protein
MLWAHLLQHADEWEERMDAEHVEDMLIDKRVVLRDEWYELDKLLDSTSRQPDISKMPTSENTLYQVLPEISRVNRHRRNFLLLRDWSKRRPW